MAKECTNAPFDSLTYTTFLMATKRAHSNAKYSSYRTHHSCYNNGGHRRARRTKITLIILSI
jgi:hypothetical protein